MTEESKLLEEVKNYLTKNKILYWRMQAQSNLYGLPDICALYKGIFLGFELKAKKGKTTKLQEITMKNINEAGGIAKEIRSLDDIKNEIKNIDKIFRCVQL